MSGLFITFEGGEGSGKTTIIKKLAAYYQDLGFGIRVTREPGGVKIAEQIRNVILDVNNKEMNPKTEAILYAASRVEHLDKVVIPELERGSIILCDRYIDSSLVYQGYARGLGIEKVMQINMFALDYLPKITFFFDVTPEVALERIKKNHREENRLDLESLEFHRAVYDGYVKLTEMFPERIIRIDGDRDIEDIFRDCVKEIDKIL